MLETERTILTYLNEELLPHVEALFCKNEVVMESTLKGRVFTKNEFLELVKNEFSTPTSPTGFLCILLKESNTFIGVTGLLQTSYNNQKAYEFGFILLENSWGIGYATEIGQFWIEYATKHNIPELIATASPDNLASINVLEKLNMTLVNTINSKERGRRNIYHFNLSY